MDLALLFTASLVAATFLPAQSEAILAALYLTGDYSPLLLIAIATCGNVAGACINWQLGRYIDRFKSRRWFPIKAAPLESASRRFQRYGVGVLLFSWVPIIGDPLTVIAGLLQVPFPLFFLLVTIGKLMRYIVVVAMF